MQQTQTQTGGPGPNIRCTFQLSTKIWGKNFNAVSSQSKRAAFQVGGEWKLLQQLGLIIAISAGLEITVRSGLTKRIAPDARRRDWTPIIEFCQGGVRGFGLIQRLRHCIQSKPIEPIDLLISVTNTSLLPHPLALYKVGCVRSTTTTWGDDWSM